MGKKETAAKMAGEWWAARLHERYAEQRAAFAAAVERRTLQELCGECYWDSWGVRHEGAGYEKRSRAENDYDPKDLLVEALREALPGESKWKLRDALPRKHELDVTPDRLKPKEGYGNWTAEIPVVAQDPVAGG